MGVKKLISPEFRVTVGDYEVTEGIEVECFSSKISTHTPTWGVTAIYSILGSTIC